MITIARYRQIKAPAVFVLIALLLVFTVASANTKLDAEIETARSEGQTALLMRLLLQRGEQLRASGFLRDAQPSIREAVDLSSAIGNPALRAVAMSALAQLYATPVGNAALIGNWPDPSALFSESQALARESSLAAVNALVQARVGAWQQQQGQYTQALQSYSQSHSDALRAEDASQQTLALTGVARAQFALNTPAAAVSSLRQAAESGRALTPAAQVSANLALVEIARELPTAKNLWAQALETNDGLKEQLEDPRLLALHYAEMGRWFEIEQEVDVSLDYTELAIRTVPDAHDLAYGWEWRLGRLFEQQGDQLAAINAYRRAARHVEAIRQDIPVTYSEGRSSFRETLAPIFLRLADLLMLQADKEPANKEVQALLVESQDIVEQLKSSELQDYFRNSCVINQSQLLDDDVLANTAVLYPIILPDRLAILLKLASGFHHVSVPVESKEIDRTVDLLVDSLQNPLRSHAYRPHARRINDWLITPVSTLLQESGVSTLFFVPDGSLRRVPLAALWDGAAHLVERYAIASAPGLTLLNAEPFSSVDPVTLLAGVSEPGDVLDEIDPAIVSAFVEGYQQRRSRGLVPLRKVPAKTTNTGESDVDIRVEAFRLPAVSTEVQSLANVVPSTVLLDDGFKLDDFRQRVTDGNHRVVHIASHGYFGGSAEDSWLMAHDKLLDMNQLSRLFKPKEFADQPIELLILSACQTAEGNDQAPLGLSGVALASGARSVLGSLWVVADDATSELMQSFYARLTSRESSKAQALRQAQLATMQNKQFSHPFYWAPFVLIGSWL